MKQDNGIGKKMFEYINKAKNEEINVFVSKKDDDEEEYENEVINERSFMSTHRLKEYQKNKKTKIFKSRLMIHLICLSKFGII